MDFEIIKKKAEEADIITFDVFDTLITRMVLHPADVFSLVSLLKTEELNLKFNFREARINAELELYKSGNRYYNLSDIYSFIAKVNQLDNGTINALKEAEISSEEKLVCPRVDIKSFVLDLYKSGKTIIFVSDMYLSSEHIKRLLKICGYPDDIELLVSNELNKSKHDGSLWESFFDKFSDKKTLHFGDSKRGDYDMVKKFSHEAVLLDNPTDRLISTEMFGNLYEYDNGEFGNSLLLGKLSNQILFNNAFSDNYDENAILGMWMGSVLSCFMRWLIYNKDDSMLLFVTREGYILRPMYLEYCKAAGVEPQKSCLFYTSRRASASASLKTKKDIEELLDSSYNGGKIKDLLEHRFGYFLDNEEIGNTYVELPKDKKKVLNLISSYIEDILENSKKMRSVYLDYIYECKSETEIDKLTIVDLGYEGRAQYYLSRITGSRISGKYLFLNPKPFPEHIGCKCNCLANTADSLHPVYDNLIYLESALSVPYGQVQKLSRDDSGAIIPECGKPNEVSAQVSEAQKEFINHATKDASWFKLLDKDYSSPLILAEDIWSCLLYYGYLPESYLNSFCMDDHFFGNNWSFDIRNKSLHSGDRVAPFIFHRKDCMDYKKQKIKNYVKYRAPQFLYEPLRQFWIKFIK